MRIFEASSADIVRMMDCARRCCAEHGAETIGGEFDDSHYETVLGRILESGDGAMLLIDDGGEIVGGICFAVQVAMLTGRKVARQVFWYMEPSRRGSIMAARLVIEAEKKAAEMGCDQISMPVLPTMPAKSRQYFIGRGYVEIETTYRKKL